MAPFTKKDPRAKKNISFEWLWLSFRWCLPMHVDDDSYFLNCKNKGSVWHLFTHGKYFQPQRALIKHWYVDYWNTAPGDMIFSGWLQMGDLSLWIVLLLFLLLSLPRISAEHPNIWCNISNKQKRRWQFWNYNMLKISYLHDMTKQTIETNLIYRPIVMILL